MRQVWMIVTVTCALIAVFFLIRRNTEAAFVLAAIGAVAWFLSYRSQVKSSIRKREEHNDEEQFDLDEQS